MPASPLFVNTMFYILTNSYTFTSGGTTYLALFRDAGCTTEASGGSYIRQPAYFPSIDTSATSNTIATVSACTFTNMVGGSYAGAGVYDHQTDPTRLMLYTALATPLVLATGDTLTFSAGQIILSGS